MLQCDKNGSRIVCRLSTNNRSIVPARADPAYYQKGVLLGFHPRNHIKGATCSESVLFNGSSHTSIMIGLLSLVYQKFDWQTFAIGVAILIVSTHLIPYVLDPYSNRKYPGPFLAKFSDAWLGWVSKSGHRSEVVHAMHEKYGLSYNVLLQIPRCTDHPFHNA